jgi:SET domain
MSQRDKSRSASIKLRPKVEKTVQQKYDKTFYENNPDKKKQKWESSKIRNQRISFFAKFGMKCVEVGLHKEVLKSVTDQKIIDAVNEYARCSCTSATNVLESSGPGKNNNNNEQSVHPTRSSARLKIAQPIIRSKVPVKYSENATQCEYCEETCGPNGCSAECVCYSEQRVCNHTDEYYYCAAMPHRHVYPKKKIVEEGYLSGIEDASFGYRFEEDVYKYAFVGEYTGELVNACDETEVMKRLKEPKKYMMLLEDYYIDGKFGNEMRYINASCKPNVVFQLWHVPHDRTQQYRVFGVAKRDINNGEMGHTTYGWAKGEYPIYVKCMCKLTAKCIANEAHL